MKFYALACLLFMQTLTFAYGSVLSSELWVSVPVDQKAWKPLYPSLPYDQNVLWLAPEGEESPIARKEFLVVRKGPVGSKVENLSVTLSEINPEHEFARTSTPEGAFALAVNDLRVGHFTVLRFFQGPDAVYEIRYEAPEKLLSESEKQAWWKRINEATADRSFNNPTWLSLTPSGVSRNKELIKHVDKWITYRHKTLPFTLELPESWTLEESAVTPGATNGNSGFIPALAFTRLDKLVHGAVTIAIRPSVVPEEELEREWQESIQFLKDQSGPVSILAHGDFKNKNGGRDRFVITGDGDSISWKVFHTRDVNTYQVEVWMDKGNLSLVRETLHKILSSLTVS